MGKPAYYACHLLLLMLLLAVHRSNQKQPSQLQTLLQIQQLLNYPSGLSSNDPSDFCTIEPTPELTVACYEDNITQLHISGSGGVPPILPERFSTESFFGSLASLSSLKVLSLVSLGLLGSLPGTVGQLSSLEILNVSSNYFHGPIPTELSSLKNLQTLILDHNKFTGEVPAWLSSLPALAVLSLKNNSLTGSLPNSLENLESLRVLALSRNQLTGQVPDLHNLRNLQVLDLQDNYLGPHFPSLHNRLVSLSIRNNSFRFGIPSELGSYYQLQKLDISLNGFVGPFLPSLLALPSITHLDIGGNKLTGMLLENMSCNAELNFINLSSNLLTGELPTCLQSTSSIRTVLYAQNCLSSKEQEQNPSIFCHNEALAVKVLPHETKGKRNYAKPVLASSIFGGTIGGIAMVGLVVLVIKYSGKKLLKNNCSYGKHAMKKPSTKLIMENVPAVNTAKLLTDARYISQTMKLGASLPAYRTFAVEELKEATNNFDVSTLMGEGSNGQNYRGKLSDGTLVVIRRLKMRKKHGAHTYTHQIEMISRLRHSHLVSALGHCFECSPDDSSVTSIYLVFEFITNQTLRDCTSEALQGQKFSWMQRIASAIEVAKAVQFLHTGIVPGVFSNNLKITDVLLDQDLHVKISSYNHPLLAENSEQAVVGASFPGRKTSTWESSRHDDKNDVFDIGVILLEIIVGRPIMSKNEVIVVKDLLLVSMKVDDIARRSVADPAIFKDCTDNSLKTVMEICVRCLSDKPMDRPSIEDVLWNLQFAAQVQDSWRMDCENIQDQLPVSSPSQEL